MNKSALKTFATSARKELLKKVEAKAMKIGITEDNIKIADIESSDAIFIDGKQLSKGEKVQRDKLITRIKRIGFKQVMEEVAYTWFNRFTALRFMEVKDYLPTGVRILSSSNPNSADPDMLNEALELDLEIELDKEYIYELKLNNQTEELFKYLIIKHCNDLNRYLPFMFETIDDYTEILFPEGLLAKDSFIRQMIDTEFIPEDNWQKVEIIGWLYQFYIAEEKDRVFKEKKKYRAEEIPYATQLFTPDWIVRYMVQNSLGHYWVESHPEHRDLLENWEFYLENEQDLEEKLVPYINKELKVEDIKCFDPAMGSGHILVYMFDVLYEIYSKCGYMEREIPRLIIEKNLYGLDIDDRAYQLACFSIVMKALEYNPRFFRSIEREGLEIKLASIQETNHLTNDDIAYIAGEKTGENFDQLKAFLAQFKDAKSIGSLLNVTLFQEEFIETRYKLIKESPVEDLFQIELRERSLLLLPQLIKQALIMSNKYDVLVTNPPYMGSGNMNDPLSKFLKKNYPNSKSDLFASFMEVDHYLNSTSFYASINQHSWMFLSSFEKLRDKIINHKTISSMLHLGPRAFEEIGGEVVQSTAFVLRNTKIEDIKGIYVRLIEERTAKDKKEKAKEAVINRSVSYRFECKQNKFKNIPGLNIAYWISENFHNLFVKGKPVEDVVTGVSKGIFTGDNKRFLRYWFEVDYRKVENREWNKYSKGGSFRKWYGNSIYVINWKDDASELRSFPGSGMGSSKYYGLPHIVWSGISTSSISFRYDYDEVFFDDVSPAIIVSNDKIIQLLCVMNSKPIDNILKIMAPTMHYQIGDIKILPIIDVGSNKEKVDILGKESLDISKREWNSFEISWDFKGHPLLNFKNESQKINNSYTNWSNYLEVEFNKLKNNEEELNRIFIDIYGLTNEMTPEVQEQDVSIRKADLVRDINSFISYAVGCIFGRYSLDKEGLIYTGGEFIPEEYPTYKADEDNIIPILLGAYFEDDIISKFIKFVEITFSKETLAENLDFIADTLGKKKGETAKESIRRYFLNDFFKDHVQTYKKRPIYWLFTSGKQKAFNCLIYMHRYDKTTLSRIRTDYLHEYQIRLDAEKKDLLGIIEGDYSTKEISNAKKELKTLDKKIEELKEYDEVLHHMADMQIEINLDDGVIVNYEKFKGLVAKI